ncbi:MAG: PadR family transcriptional regulator [Anaerolineae bacterium]
MSLKHAILGFLHFGPQTGYDLKTRCFDRSVRHFWPAEQSQIYRTLDRLRADGLAEMTVEPQTDRPSRKVYTITEAGRAEFGRWLEEDLPLTAYRDPFLIQLFFAELLPLDEVRARLEAQVAQHQARLVRYRGEVQAALNASIAETGQTHAGVFWQMTLDWGIRLEEAWLAWANDCLEALQSLEEARE